MPDMSDEIDNDAYRITGLIQRLSRAMGQKAGAHLQHMGIAAADRAVMELIYPDKKLSVPEIARRYRASRQHVQVTVNSLVAKGLAEAVENPDHKRSPLITLTEEGRAMFKTILHRHREVTEALFADVPPADRRQARETLEKLLNKLT